MPFPIPTSCGYREPGDVWTSCLGTSLPLSLPLPTRSTWRASTGLPEFSPAVCTQWSTLPHSTLWVCQQNPYTSSTHRSTSKAIGKDGFPLLSIGPQGWRNPRRPCLWWPVTSWCVKPHSHGKPATNTHQGPEGLPFCKFWFLMRKGHRERGPKKRRDEHSYFNRPLLQLLWCLHLANSKSCLNSFKMNLAMTGCFQPRILRI